MRDSVMDLDALPPVHSFAGDIDRRFEAGELSVGVSQKKGQRYTQEDAFFVTAAPARNSAEIPDLLQQTFADVAEQVVCEGYGGSTATVAVISADNKLSIAHLGDSPALVFIRDPATGHVEARELIKMHNVHNPEEVERVKADGGTVDCNRVQGGDDHGILLTRRFGNNSLFPGLSSTPDVTQLDLSAVGKPGDQVFVCVACDGLFEGDIKPQEYATLIEDAFKQGKQDNIPQLMARYAYERGSGDNLTVAFTEVPPKQAQDLVIGVMDGHGGRRTAMSARDLLDQALGPPGRTFAPAIIQDRAVGDDTPTR